MISGISQYSNDALTSGANATSTSDRLSKMFAKMDANGDGVVDKAEFAAFRQKHVHKGESADKASNFFSKIDSDGDGQISKAEFEAFITSMQSKSQPAISAASNSQPEEMNSADLFTKMDVNGDGYVDKSEFTTFHENRVAQSNPADSTQQIFSAIDTDGDGKISQAESDTFMSNMKSQMVSMMSGSLASALNSGQNGESSLNSLYNASAQLVTLPLANSSQSLLDVVG